MSILKARCQGRSLLADRSGGVLIMGALALPVVIGIAALATEYGSALLTRSAHQRIADAASFAGALAYGKSSGSESAMDAAARKVATMNGVPDGDVAVALVASPRDADAQAVRVDISGHQPLLLSRILSSGTSLEIANVAFSEIALAGHNDTGACILALDPAGTGITLSGGTSVRADDCDISSNAAVAAPCGTHLRAAGLNVAPGKAIADCTWTPNLLTASGQQLQPERVETPDPMEGHAAIAAATGRFTTVRALKAPLAPALSGAADIHFVSWGSEAALAEQRLRDQGCDPGRNNTVWNVTCTGDTMNFGKFTVGGNQTVNFNVDRAATYNFSGSIENMSVMNFGPGTYNVAGGIRASGSARTTFGAGAFRVGRVACNNGSYSICADGSGQVTVAGPSSFDLSAGVQATGAGVLKLGAGSTNAYRIGAGSTGRAIDVSSTLVLADALASNSQSPTVGSLGDITRENSSFVVVGNVATGGGSCLVFGRSRHHDFTGNVDIQGALSLGAGIYTVDGFLALGQNSGGASNCDGSHISLRGTEVTLVVSGKTRATSWACRETAFCAGAGYNNMTLEAPTSGPLAKMAVLGPQASANTAGMTFTAGASAGRFAGLVYFPHGPLSLGGGAGIAGGTSCLQLIARQVTLTGGTTAASECVEATAPSGAPATSVRLVQ